MLSIDNSVVIIGSGIVGLSTALSLKEKDPTQDIIVIDHSFPPSGASTKNAGFYCFGSFSEVLSDLKNMSEEECLNLIRLRWQGGQILKSRLKKNILQTGGYELFSKGCFPVQSEINKINAIFEKAIGIRNYLTIGRNAVFPFFDPFLIKMSQEGMLDPMVMINTLYKECLNKDIKFIFGQKVLNIDQENRSLITENGKIKYYKCVICTNGFTNQLMPDCEVNPARNMVLITEPIPDLKWEGVFHFDEGYYYFRNVGKRILLGGARNLDPETENTSEFGINRKIQEHLQEFLYDKLLNHRQVEISTMWSGILGVSKSKIPIIKKVTDGLFMGVRLGGMGVAIGSLMGEKLADLILKNND